MRWPHDNFPQDWNLTAGLGFGAQTSYGYHEAIDINDKGGGNSDLGKPIYAIADGIVTSVHRHFTIPTFGNHIHYSIKGAWGERFVHCAHMKDIFVEIGQTVKEGQKIGTIGNSGTTWAHHHFAIKKQPTGIDSIANTLIALKKWEDPLQFIRTWMNVTPPNPNPNPNPPTPQPMPTYSFRQLIQIYYRIFCLVDPSEDEYRHWEQKQQEGWNEIQIGTDIIQNDSRSIYKQNNTNLANFSIKQLAQEIVNRT